jgi:hypothetical protein
VPALFEITFDLSACHDTGLRRAAHLLLLSLRERPSLAAPAWTVRTTAKLQSVSTELRKPFTQRQFFGFSLVFAAGTKTD